MSNHLLPKYWLRLNARANQNWRVTNTAPSGLSDDYTTPRRMILKRRNKGKKRGSTPLYFRITTATGTGLCELFLPVYFYCKRTDTFLFRLDTYYIRKTCHQTHPWIRKRLNMKILFAQWYFVIFSVFLSMLLLLFYVMCSSFILEVTPSKFPNNVLKGQIEGPILQQRKRKGTKSSSSKLEERKQHSKMLLYVIV